jgi:IS605 OrfB family transposase
MTTQRFKTIVVKTKSRTSIAIPFNPNEVWSVKQRHHITGSVNGCAVRGSLGSDGSQYFLPLGAAWRRDNGVEAGAEVEVALSPEGPQADTLAPDMLAALENEPEARAFFESLKWRQEAAAFRRAEECRAAFGLHKSLLCSIIQYMKLTAQLKLLPTSDQADALRRMLETTNAACNSISDMAWQTHVFGKFALQKLCYQDVRKAFGLSAQVVIRALAKVGDAYKLDTRTKRVFRPLASIAYDDRILSWNLCAPAVSIWTLDGRLSIPFIAGERQMQLLQTRMGETDLVYHRGNWYLLATCEIQEPDPQDSDDVLGIDLGVTNIATDSDGLIYSGSTVRNVRYRHRRLRNKLQRKGTLGSRRRLKILAGQEARFAKHVNHVISKGIVAKAKRTKRAIAVEDLTHIRTRVRARRSQRATLHSWSFAQLQAFLAYKALGIGVPVHRVDPRNTSRRCPRCGHVAKANRKTQSTFVCMSCGCAGLADMIAAENIRVLGRAAVNPPHCSDADGSVAPEQSRRL